MNIFKIDKRSGNFTIVDNRVFLDETLSWKAKGILGYLLSRPKDWKVRLNDLVNKSQNGESSVRTGLNELLETDYVEKVIQRNDDGTFKRWDYYVFEDPADNYFSKEEGSINESEVDSEKEKKGLDTDEPGMVNQKMEKNRSDPFSENDKVDLNDVDPVTKNRKMDLEAIESFSEKSILENSVVENITLNNKDYTNTDNTNKEKTTTIEEKVVEVKEYWFKTFGTHVENDLDKDVRSLLDTFSVKLIKEAIYRRSKASYYKSKKPDLKKVPQCFFCYPKTVKRDSVRIIGKPKKSDDQVYQLKKEDKSKVENVRREHLTNFGNRDSKLNPPGDSEFVKEMLDTFKINQE